MFPGGCDIVMVSRGRIDLWVAHGRVLETLGDFVVAGVFLNSV